MGFLSGLVQAALPAVGSYFGGPIGGAIGTAVASGMASENAEKSQEQTNMMNIAQSQKQMDFQERMSSTAHQREVADLQAAGLNPILSVNRSGATTPSGSQATLVSPVLAGSTSALQKAQTSKVLAETDTEREHTVVARTEAEQARWLFNNVPKFLEEKLAHAVYQNLISQETLKKLKEEISNLAKEGKLIDAETASVQIQTVLKKHAIPEAKAFGDYFATELGKKVPYIREGEGLINSASKLFNMSPAARTYYRGQR